MFEPPGSRDPLLGAEVGRRRRDSSGDGFWSGLSGALDAADWWAWPVVAVMLLATMIFVVWQRYFGRDGGFR